VITGTGNHNDMLNIQGGTTGQYYHLTSAEYTNLDNVKMFSGGADPTAGDIPTGYAKLWKNTSAGEIRLWVNDSGTLYNVRLT